MKYERRVELRRSGASGTHGDSRLKRLRTKAAQNKAAIKDSQD